MFLHRSLPHPNIISIAFLDLPQARAPSLALLSISSNPSRIPGLGTQCLPVLSFHMIDEKGQNLVPLPWGPERKVPPIVKQATGKVGDETRLEGASCRRFSASSSQPTASREQLTPNASSNKFGPAALGRTLTAAQARAREQSLAKSALARAHVTLPFADALGAHLLTALPDAVGGCVIVWSETSILIVTPPIVESTSPLSPQATNATSGKRRKASTSVSKIASSDISYSQTSRSKSGASPPFKASEQADQVSLSTSPSSNANEHGKRSRSSVKKSGSSAEPASSPPAVEEHRAPALSDDFEGLKILRLSLPRPIQVTSAAIIRESASPDSAVQLDPSGTRATISILFATAAGHLNILQATFLRCGLREHWQPHNMRTSRVGRIPRPSGPESLNYLGEGFVHIASASGDSLIVHLMSHSMAQDPAGFKDDAETVDLPTSPAPAARTSVCEKAKILPATQHLSSNSAFPDLPDSGLRCTSVHVFPSLAPIIDFIIDGDANAPKGGAQARIIAACGTGPDGAIAVVKTGVSLERIGSLNLTQARQLWSISLNESIIVVCGFVDYTQVLSIGKNTVADITDTLSNGGIGASRTLMAAQLAGRQTWAHVSDEKLVIYDIISAQQVSVWDPKVATGDPAATVTAASLNGDRAILALRGGRVFLMEVFEDTLKILDSIGMSYDVSAVDIALGFAVIGQWGSNSLHLYSIAKGKMDNVAPSSLSSVDEGLGGLPVSCKLHRFSHKGSTNLEAVHLLVGLSTGSLLSYVLSIPNEESFSQTIGLHDRKIFAFGKRPVRLTPFTTSTGKHAIMATNGDAPIAIWADRPGHLSFSALGYHFVLAAAPVYLTEFSPVLLLALPDSVEIAVVGEVGRLDISKKDFGLENPTAITGVESDFRKYSKYFVVLTNPFKPEGSATREQRKAKIVVVDSGSLDRVYELELESNERANCVASVQLNGTEYVAVGTGFVKPDDTETTDGRLLLYIVRSSSRDEISAVELHQSFEEHVDGNVYAVAGIADKLLCAINSEVLSFDILCKNFIREDAMDTEDASDKSLECLSRWGCAFIACTLSPVGDDPRRVVVGDALRSLCVLEVDPRDGAITEIARDCDPFWTSASASLDSATQTYIGADISFNLYTSQRAQLSPETRRRIEREEEMRREQSERGDARADVRSSNTIPLPRTNEEWSHVMERRGAWHYGDLVNRMREGCLVNKATSLLSNGKADRTDKGTRNGPGLRVDPRIVFATASGALAIISSLDEATGKVLSEVERNMREFTQPLGAISHEEWRTLRTDHRKSDPAGFLDGELLMQFATGLSATEQARVLAGVRGGENDRVHATFSEVKEMLIDGIGRVC